MVHNGSKNFEIVSAFLIIFDLLFDLFFSKQHFDGVDDEATLLLLLAFFRPKTWVLVEQPASSWLPKQLVFLEVRARLKLEKILTYLGLFGASILKPTHLWTNLPALQGLERRALKAAKERFRRRQALKREAALAKGKRVKEFYKKTPNGGFHGCKDLSSTAIYPQRFATQIFKFWLETWQG